MELRILVYLLEYGFIIKGYNSGTPGGRGGIEPGVGEEAWHPHLHGFPTQKLSELPFGFLWRFHCTGIIDNSLIIGD